MKKIAAIFENNIFVFETEDRLETVQLPVESMPICPGLCACSCDCNDPVPDPIPGMW